MSLSFARFGKYAAMLFAAVSAACTQSEIDDIVTVSGNGEAHAVVFDFVAADFAGASVTRSGGPGNAGFAFENGATIHVLAEFQKEDAYGGQIIGAYECFQYNATSKTWAPLTDAGADVEIAHMVWPLHTASANFTAFYVPESKNMFTFNDDDISQTDAFPLSDIGSKNSDGFTIGDPLIATVNGVKYDGKVRLMFKHACTRLVLTDLRGSQDETYCLVRSGSGNDMNNAYRLRIERTLDDGGYHYTGAFVWDKDDESCTTQDRGSLHYVLSKLNTTTDAADTGNDPINNWLCFYLEPGNYYGASVIYRDETPCLTLKVDKLGGGEDPATDGLKENTSYTLDIRLADGVVDDELVQPKDEWAPAEEEAVKVDPKAFLEALYQGREYSVEEKPILQAVEGVGLQLMANVDFEKKNLYHLFMNDYVDSGFRKIGQNVIFDGCNHAILNINGALCKECAGEIKNLAIRQAKITFPEKVNPSTSIPDEGGSYTMEANEIATKYDYVAGIFGNVTSTGLHNILVEGIDVNITVNAGDGEDSESNTWIIGTLAGKVVNVTDIHLRGTKTGSSDRNGNLSVKVTAEARKNSLFTVGGVIGRDDTGSDVRGSVDRYVSSVSDDETASYDSPMIKVDVSVGSDFSNDADKSITNELRIGGFAGRITGNWKDVSLASCQVEVDCSKSVGKFLYAGCFAGDIGRTSTGTNRAGIDNISISGTVHNGYGTSPQIENNIYYSRVYTGGFAGHVQGFDMTDCVFSGKVEAGQRVDKTDTDTRISTGGLIGGIADMRRTNEENDEIRKNELSHIYNCTAFASITVNEEYAGSIQNTGARYYAGSCVGLQNFPNRDYNDDKDQTFVPFPSRSAKPSDLTNERNVYYAEQELPSNEGCLLDFGDGKRGWYPVNPSYGNVNRTSNPNRPFCGAYMDDTDAYAGGGGGGN